MPPKRQGRIYWRNGRAWFDGRGFEDVIREDEKVQHPLVPAGERFATTDPDVAARMASDRVKELERRRRNRGLLDIAAEGTLAAFAQHHLEEKARAGRVTERQMDAAQRHLEAAAAFFGAERELDSLGTRDVQRWAAELAQRPGRRDATMAPGTVRKYLNSLSNLYRRAQSEAVVAPGFNPVQAMMDKPVGDEGEAHWLEVHEIALLLEAARIYRPARKKVTIPYMHAILATFALTGGREREVLGLDVEDVSFDRGVIHIRPNPWRRLKTKGSKRDVPLWPQLEETLREHVFGGKGPRSGLLFPAQHHHLRGKDPQMIRDIRRPLDEIAQLAGYPAGEIRTKAFRHSYATARLQTTENGAPVALWTVAREMGHADLNMVSQVYGHLGLDRKARHRSAVVEFRVEQHRKKLEAQLLELPRQWAALEAAREAEKRKPKRRRNLNT